MADALTTLASMVKVNKQEDVKPIHISIYGAPARCYNIEEEEENDEHPWYHGILRYVKNRRKDQVLLRCVDAIEAKKILEEVHEGVCGTHANGFTMARQIMRFGYYWSTMEGDCINYAKKCHKCQIYKDKIHGMDVIGPISPKALNRHRFIFVVIDYFNKWVEAASYANVTKSTFKIRHHNSSPYCPKMNGTVEAANKNIKKMVGKMTETYKDWHEKLPFSFYTYRTSVRTSTGATPFPLVYGMEAVLPIKVEITSLRFFFRIEVG
ncbi:RNA-directed DNA polymerase [Gossypium australe]|uniref:RNA-directed DNA polymerase n=1 Tax=Gossypium australe TaxID=47621 RepID=A0A5B6VXC6_9ROSI|nr:RNA-directed DNA polymerase [Gossypium australe]